MQTIPHWARHGAAIATSALLINLAAPLGAGLAPLAWIAFAPWLAVLPGLAIRSACASGLLMGLAYVAPLLWPTFAAAVAAFGTSGWRGSGVTFAFFVVYALPFGLFAGLSVCIERRWQPSALLMAPLQAGLLASLISLTWAPFPYTPAVAIAGQTSMLQLAAWGGEPLLLMLLLWPSAALALVIGRGSRLENRWSVLVIPAVTLLSVFAYGQWRMAQMDAEELRGGGASLAALPLQLDLPMQSTSVLLTRDRPGASRSALELTRRALEQAPSCELAVWPEVPLSYQPSLEVCSQAEQIARSLGVPMLMQCYRPAASQLMVSAEWLPIDGSARRWHGKAGLVPYYETPLIGSGLVAPGAPGTVFELDSERRILPAVCYGLHSRTHIRAGVLNGGVFIAHMASFAPFARHPIDRLDLAMAQLRAAEFGVPIIRSANRGPVGWIDANGRVRASSERFGRHAACEQVWSPATTPTAYTYLSPIAAWLPGSVMLLLGWRRRRR